MVRLVALLLCCPTLALAQGVVNTGPITTFRISPASPARYMMVQSVAVNSVANGAAGSVYAPAASRLVDLIVYQSSAGTSGTSFTVSIAKVVGGASLMTTPAMVTLASGANTATDAKGDIALPSGWTRPVVDSTVTVTKGQKLFINTVETGSYGTHASLVVILVLEPLQ